MIKRIHILCTILLNLPQECTTWGTQGNNTAHSNQSHPSLPPVHRPSLSMGECHRMKRWTQLHPPGIGQSPTCSDRKINCSYCQYRFTCMRQVAAVAVCTSKLIAVSSESLLWLIYQLCHTCVVLVCERNIMWSSVPIYTKHVKDCNGLAYAVVNHVIHQYHYCNLTLNVESTTILMSHAHPLLNVTLSQDRMGYELKQVHIHESGRIAIYQDLCVILTCTAYKRQN